MALPHAYGRLQFGEDLELHFRTMIGTGANPNVAACIVIGIEPGWTNRIVEGIAETGKPVAGFWIEQNGDLKTIMDASRKAKEFVHIASELQREPCDVSELWVSTKCGESDTTTGLGSCPTVGNMYDKLHPGRHLRLLRRDVGDHRRRAHLQGTRGNAGGRRALVRDVEGLSGRRDRGEQGRRSVREPADQGQHRGRADDDRGEGARQSREDRPAVPLHRHSRAGRGAAERARPLLHGLVVGRGGVRDSDGGRRLCRPHLPDRAGQRHRQPDRAGDQDHPPTRARCGRWASTSTST